MRRDKRKDEYDDTNFSVLNALNYELTQAEQETIASKIQSSLESATGEYLDTWGDWFGVYRKDGWDDDYYRGRIIRYLLLKRSTIPAIIDALIDFLEDNDAHIEIYEPWKNIFYTNKSKLNGEDHLMGYYYRFAIIDISIDRSFPPEIIEVIRAFKPAGVLFYVRLDMSKNPSTTPVQYPFAFIDVSNKTELDIMNGLTYDINGNINLTDQTEQVVTNDIFHTNRSLLNGDDVLAGSFTHDRGYLHLASTIILDDYLPKPEDTMTDVKLALGESNPDFYLQTKNTDGRTATITVAKADLYTAYANSTDGTVDFLTEHPNPNIFCIEDWRVKPEFTSNGIPAMLYHLKPNTDYTLSTNIPINAGGFYDVFLHPEGEHASSNINGVRAGKPRTITTNDQGTLIIAQRDYSLDTGEWWMKLEEGTEATLHLTNPKDSVENSRMKYVGYSPVESTNPADFTWKPFTGETEVFATKTYAVFDIKAFIANNYAIEFAMLQNELGEEEALNTLFSEFDVSTSLKAMVSPSDGLVTNIQIYDFQADQWHGLLTTTLDLSTQTFNLSVNQVMSYLNDNRLMFIRYVFGAKEGKDVSVELDMLNVLFHYRMGNGYSMGLQSSVVSWQDFPVDSLTLNKTNLDLAIASNEKLTATILPETATNKKVEWVSSNPTIATVDELGNITGVAEGQTEIIAYGDNREIEARCTVNVYKPVTSIEATPSEVNLTI